MSRTASRKGVSGSLIRDSWVGKENGENNKGLADCKHGPGSARRAAGETKWPDGLMIYSWVGGEKRSQIQQYISSLWLERCVRREQLVVKITCTKKEEDSGQKGAWKRHLVLEVCRAPSEDYSRKNKIPQNISGQTLLQVSNTETQLEPESMQWFRRRILELFRLLSPCTCWQRCTLYSIRLPRQP